MAVIRNGDLSRLAPPGWGSPMGKWKSREPGGEGLADWGAARSSERAARLTWSHRVRKVIQVAHGFPR